MTPGRRSLLLPPPPPPMMSDSTIGLLLREAKISHPILPFTSYSTLKAVLLARPQ